MNQNNFVFSKEMDIVFEVTCTHKKSTCRISIHTAFQNIYINLYLHIELRASASHCCHFFEFLHKVFLGQ